MNRIDIYLVVLSISFLSFTFSLHKTGTENSPRNLEFNHRINKTSLDSISHPKDIDHYKLESENKYLSANSNCQNARSIKFDTDISGTTSGASIEDLTLCHLENKATVWYTLDGIDSVIHINIAENSADNFNVIISRGECGNMTCFNHQLISQENNISFFADQGITYLIAVQAPYNQEEATYSFLVTKSSPLKPNLSCYSATEVECSGQIIGDFDGALTTEIEGCYPSYIEASLWYRIDGDDYNYYLHNNSVSQRYYVSIFENDCDALTCIRSEILGGHTSYVSFTGRKNQTYFLRIGKLFDDNDFDISIECQALAINDECENPIALQSTSNCTFEEFSFICSPSINNSELDIWFSFQGHKNARILVDSFSGSKADINIYSGSCDSLVPINLSNNNPFYPDVNAFNLDTSQQYFCQIYQDNRVDDHQRNVSICYYGFDAAFNDDIQSAQDLVVDSICPSHTISTHKATPSLPDGDKDIWFAVETPTNGNLELELTHLDGKAIAFNRTTMELYANENDKVIRISNMGTYIKRSMLQVFDSIYVRIRNYENRDHIEDFNLCIKSFGTRPNDNVLTATQIQVHDTFVEESIDIMGLSISLNNSNAYDYWRYAIVPVSGNLDVKVTTDYFVNSTFVLNLFQLQDDSLVQINATDQLLEYNESFSKRIEGLNPGDTLYIQYDPFTDPTNVENPRLTVRAYDKPINELISQAIKISADSACNPIRSSLHYAEGDDLWYYYIPSETGLAMFDFLSFEGDGYSFHEVYAYQKRPELTIIGTNVDHNDRLQNALFDTGASSDTVFIKIAEFFATTSYEEFEFCLRRVEPAENNFCDDAVELFYDSIPANFKTFSFGTPTISSVPTDKFQCNEYFENQFDVWFKFNPTEYGDYIFEISSDERFEIYEGNCDSLILLTCNATLTVSNSRRMQVDSLDPNNQYYLKVMRSTWDNFDSLNIAVYDWIRNPYDEVEDAYNFPLTTECNTKLFSLDFATRNFDEGQPCNISSYSNFESDIWIKAAVPRTGNISLVFEEVDSPNASQRLSYEVYSKDSSNELTRIYCASYSSHYSRNEAILHDLENHDTIYISFHSNNYDKQGEFTLCIHSFDDPVNDSLEHAIFIEQAIECSPQVYTTKYSRIEDLGPGGDCNFSSYYADGDLWFKTLTSASGSINVEYDRIDFAIFNLEFYQKIGGNFIYLDCFRQRNYHIDIIQNEFTGFPENDTIYIRFIETDVNVLYGRFGMCFFGSDQSEYVEKKIEGPSAICVSNSQIEYTVTGLDHSDSIVLEYSNLRIVKETELGNNFSLNLGEVDTSTITLHAYGKYELGTSHVEPLEIQIIDPQICEIIYCSEITNSLIVGESATFGIRVSSIFHARHELFSSAVIDNQNFIVFKAGEEVLLNEGFTVEHGSSLKITIETCPED